jgi:hypothetical protein
MINASHSTSGYVKSIHLKLKCGFQWFKRFSVHSWINHIVLFADTSHSSQYNKRLKKYLINICAHLLCKSSQDFLEIFSHRFRLDFLNTSFLCVLFLPRIEVLALNPFTCSEISFVFGTCASRRFVPIYIFFLQKRHSAHTSYKNASKLYYDCDWKMTSRLQTWENRL